ncbi:hypothetical protein F5X98DRAFT_336054 [Xylaria grammica]|nr:hypothetical protein F5X98DRAFT_336054 [Xylaria grammica]
MLPTTVILVPRLGYIFLEPRLLGRRPILLVQLIALLLRISKTVNYQQFTYPCFTATNRQVTRQPIRSRSGFTTYRAKQS